MLVGEVFIKPRRLKTYSKDDIDYYIDIYNGKKDLYETVYQYEDFIDVSTVIVDKIFLDFDFNVDMKFLHDVRTVATYLYDNDYLFTIRFSGNGFHILIYLTQDELSNPKMAIRQYVNFLHKETDTESDPAVIGDLRRVIRIPNTLNIKHKEHFYCIPLKYTELMSMSYEDIRKMAKNPRDESDFFNGHRYLNISEWDTLIVEECVCHDQQNVILDTNISNDLPACIRAAMRVSDLGNLGRMQLILFLRDLGYSKEEVEDILFSFLSEEKFKHSVFEEHQIEHLFNKDYMFSDCNVQKQNGFCMSELCKGHGLYY